MPRVEGGRRRVSKGELPGARKRSSETFESAGGATAQATAGLGRVVAGVGAELLEQQQERAEQVANLATLRQMNDLEHKILRDPDHGMLNKRGLEVMQNRDAALGEFDTAAAAIGAGLKSDKQKAYFEAQLVARRDGVRQAIDIHGSRELTTYQAQEAEATLGSLVNGAIEDPDDLPRIARNLHDAEQIIDTHGAALGLGPEARASRKSALRSQVHTGVIERLLATERDVAAAEYFDEVQDQIAGPERGKVERALEEGTRRGQAQTIVDSIMSSATSLTEARRLVKERVTNDPKLRDEATQRVEHEFLVRDKEERDAREQLEQRAFNLLDESGGNLRRIPPAEWDALPGNTKASLRSYARQLAKGEPVETDLPTFYELLRSSVSSPAEFARVPLLQYRDRLDEGDFKQLAGLQASLRSGGDRKAANESLEGIRTNMQIAQGTLRDMGVDTGDSREARDKGDTLRASRFMRRVDEAVLALQASSGRKASSTDVQAIADQLAQEVVTEGPSWWFGSPTTKRRYELTPEEQTRADYLAITPAERRQIDEALRKKGRPINDDERLNLYIANSERLAGGK